MKKYVIISSIVFALLFSLKIANAGGTPGTACVGSIDTVSTWAGTQYLGSCFAGSPASWAAKKDSTDFDTRAMWMAMMFDYSTIPSLSDSELKSDMDFVVSFRQRGNFHIGDDMAGAGRALFNEVVNRAKANNNTAYMRSLSQAGFSFMSAADWAGLTDAQIHFIYGTGVSHQPCGPTAGLNNTLMCGPIDAGTGLQAAEDFILDRIVKSFPCSSDERMLWDHSCPDPGSKLYFKAVYDAKPACWSGNVPKSGNFLCQQALNADITNASVASGGDSSMNYSLSNISDVTVVKSDTADVFATFTVTATALGGLPVKISRSVPKFSSGSFPSGVSMPASATGPTSPNSTQASCIPTCNIVFVLTVSPNARAGTYSGSITTFDAVDTPSSIKTSTFNLIILPAGSSSNLPAGCTSTVGYSPTTGVKCDGTANSNLPSGCTSTVGYSPTTGVKCDGSGAGPSSGGGTQDTSAAVHLSANSTSVGAGQSVMLSWTSANLGYGSCSIKNELGNNIGGNWLGTSNTGISSGALPSGSHTFTITCSSSISGYARDSVTVSVGGATTGGSGYTGGGGTTNTGGSSTGSGSTGGGSNGNISIGSVGVSGPAWGYWIVANLPDNVTRTLPAGVQQGFIELSTNKAARCAWSTDANASFSSMKLFSYATTSEYKNMHYNDPANYVIPFTGGQTNSTGGVNYTYYVNCKDQAGNTNPTNFPIKFTTGTVGTVTSNQSTYNTNKNYDYDLNCADGKFPATVQVTGRGIAKATWAYTGGNLSTCQIATDNGSGYKIPVNVFPDQVAYGAGTTKDASSFNNSLIALVKYLGNGATELQKVFLGKGFEALSADVTVTPSNDSALKAFCAGQVLSGGVGVPTAATVTFNQVGLTASMCVYDCSKYNNGSTPKNLYQMRSGEISGGQFIGQGGNNLGVGIQSCTQ